MVVVDRFEKNKIREMSKQIVDFLKGRTGNNFQNDIYFILKTYYNYKQKKFEMPQAMRGDYKNDGWVIEDNLYYLIYSPILVKKSFYVEIQEKLKSDLLGSNNTPGLLENVYKKNMWGGKVEKVILLVNTKDNRMPPDNTGEYDKIIQKVKNKYGVEFECSVQNLEYVEDLLNELNYKLLDEIMFKLNMARDIDYNEPNATDIIRTIGTISKVAIEQYTKDVTLDYNRISTGDKIKINDLEMIHDDIEMIISKLSVVESAVSLMSQDVESMESFECAKNYIINIYLENKDKYLGVEMFNYIIFKVSELFPEGDKRINEIEYLVVYIFDKCDIFEKEENKV